MARDGELQGDGGSPAKTRQAPRLFYILLSTLATLKVTPWRGVEPDYFYCEYFSDKETAEYRRIKSNVDLDVWLPKPRYPISCHFFGTFPSIARYSITSCLFFSLL